MHRSRPPAIPILFLAGLVMLLAACGDGNSGADPTPPGIGDDDTNATVPRDDDGAIGEPHDEDSQTDSTDTASEDDVVPNSNRARVVGSVGDREIDVVLDEDTACAIEEPADAGGEAAAEVDGMSSDGARFTLDWSVDDGELDVRLELGGSVWTIDRDLDGVEPPVIELTRDGEVLIDSAFETDGGGSVDGVLYVNCQPMAA